MRTPPPDICARLLSRRVVRGLASVFVAGPWREVDLVARGKRAVIKSGRWLRPLIRRLIAETGDGPRPTADRVSRFLATDYGFAIANATDRVGLSGRLADRPAMWPAPGPPSGWDVPSITTPAALAEWLELTPGELAWFADVQGRGRAVSREPLRHYFYTWRPKPSGPARLIEAPKPRLKALQRRVLDGILAAIPPHEAAHGFLPGRSIRTFAAPHVGRDVVVKLDLRDFFPSVTSARVVAMFLTAGYPEPVARTLAGLCTNRVPRPVWLADGSPAQGPGVWRARRLYQTPHLPQGAPTSPALANLAAYRLDLRLAALATSAGAAYTRYADDLVFSGEAPFARAAERFVVSVAATALEEGFEVNPRKTRVMRRGVRQRAAGVVVNDRPNVPRDDFDRLKATLHNCLKHGPAAQNRDAHADFRAHLSGRVAHVAMLNPDRGEKLRRMLGGVTW